MPTHAIAASKNAAPATPNAAPKPRAAASEPTTYGATALAIRPVLYQTPAAVARTWVGYNSATTAPKPL